jgi:arylformamidase
MEASVDPLFRGPDWKPITPKRGSFLHADSHAQRHIDKLHAAITVTYGTLETPDFQRQSRDFAAAVKAAGKPVQVIEAPNYHHLEMAESLGNPYGPNGRAALALMELAPA